VLAFLSIAKAKNDRTNASVPAGTLVPAGVGDADCGFKAASVFAASSFHRCFAFANLSGDSDFAA
jgi:hypothetical protein